MIFLLLMGWLGVDLARASDPVFRSTVSGVTISNAHLIGSSRGKVYRGAEPRDRLDELLSLGVTDFLIFKNDVRGEVAEEIRELRERQVPKNRVRNIEFPWKDIDDVNAACESAVEALRWVDRVYKRPGRTVYFHCTVGEDRTGVLAGIFRIYEEGWSLEKAYQDEMCRWGFGSANPSKPAHVANDVNQNLIPVYVRAARVVERARLEKRALNPKDCQEIQIDLDVKLKPCEISDRARKE